MEKTKYAYSSFSFYEHNQAEEKNSKKNLNPFT